jgi:hypothetical protein
VNQLNLCSFDFSPLPLFDEDFRPKCESQPRVPREMYIAPKNKKARRKWNFNNSIFRSYKKDTDLHMENCFENDFALGRYNGFIKDKKDMALTKLYLKKHYREIKQVYKHYASYSGVCSTYLRWIESCVSVS